MVKAVAGGGGRGLRPVTSEDGPAEAQLIEAMRRCASEAASAFGDGRIYAERLLPRARHVEVQLIGDGTGAVAVLGDRDCSLQRRRQKLVEIAPAAVSDAVRARLVTAAAALAGSAGYAGLATAEFLVQDDEIAFLEVNPRLQVEHTVTEQVTGLDLVAARAARRGRRHSRRAGAGRGAARGRRAGAGQRRDHGAGRHVPARRRHAEPVPAPAGRGVRVDTAGYPGYTVSPHYDSLLAKVINHRRHAGGGGAPAVRALAEFDIAGVPTNAALLQALLRAPGLGTLDAGGVDAHAAELAAVVSPSAAAEKPPGGDAAELPGGDAAAPRHAARCARRWPGPWCRSRSSPATRLRRATSCSSSRR